MKHERTDSTAKFDGQIVKQSNRSWIGEYPHRMVKYDHFHGDKSLMQSSGTGSMDCDAQSNSLAPWSNQPQLKSRESKRTTW